MLKARASLSLACVLLLGLGMSLATVETAEAVAMPSSGPIRVELTFEGMGSTTGHGTGMFDPADNPMGENTNELLFGVSADYTAPGVGQIPDFAVMIRGGTLLLLETPSAPKDRVDAMMLLPAVLDFGMGPQSTDPPISVLGEVNTVDNQPSALVPGALFFLSPPVQIINTPFGPIILTNHTIIGTPEPGTLLLLGTGVAGLGVAAWRRRRR